MKYFYWLIVGIIMVLGIGFSVYMGKTSESTTMIPYSHFSAVSGLAEAILQKTKEELKTQPLVLLGVMPGRTQDLEVWKAFLALNSSPESQYQILVVDPDLPGAVETFPHALKMDLKKEQERFIEGVKKAQQKGLRTAVIVPSIYGSQILQGNPVDLIMQSSDLKPISLSLVSFPRTPEQEQSQEIPCVIGTGNHQGTGALGCAIRDKARLVYREKSEPGKYEALMDAIGEREYLILFNEVKI